MLTRPQCGEDNVFFPGMDAPGSDMERVGLQQSEQPDVAAVNDFDSTATTPQYRRENSRATTACYNR